MGSLRILDLPDEILVKIFMFARMMFDLWPDFDSNIDIQNIRLTCRRFHNIASELLISQLREISHHPLISKGVRSVKLNTALYCRTIAQDFRDLIEAYDHEMSIHIKNLEGHLKRHNHPVPAIAAIAERYKSREGRAALESFKEFVAGLQDLDEATPLEAQQLQTAASLAILERAHVRYQNRYEDQERILKDGSLVKIIAATCGRLPMLNKLIICDHKAGRHNENYIKMANDDNALISSLVGPNLWEQEEPEDWSDAGSQLLINLPVAIHKAGAAITSFHVAISAPYDFQDLVPSEADCHDLRLAASKLTDFMFKCEPRSFDDGPRYREPSEVEAVKTYVGLFIDTEGIESLDLAFDSLWDRDYPTLFSLGALLNIRQWP